MRSGTYRLALGGVLSSLAVALMFFGAAIPFATYAVPAAASLTVLFFALEFSRSRALLVYAAVSLLSALLAPDKEMAFLFVCFFGYYPVLKGVFEGFDKKLPEWLAKFATFDVSVVAFYLVAVNLAVLPAVRDEFAQYTKTMLIVLLAAGNVTFFVYDLALSKLITVYWRRLRPKLIKGR